MWKKRILPLLAAVSMLLSAPAFAAPELSAASSILMDGSSGRVLYEHNAREERLIASITKIMTALVAIESTPDLDQMVTVKREYTLAEGSSMYLKEGEQLPLRTLLYGLLLASGNDAALAIAGFCAGSEPTFVDWMNQRAQSLGMTHTHFSNPNGLNDETHYSTAEDMARLTREAMGNAVFAEIVATKSITLGAHSFQNHNKLLWRYEEAVGVKTGYTELAGRTLVSCAVRNGQQLIAVTLDDPNDWDDHVNLFEYGFQTYPEHILCRVGKRLFQLPVLDGEEQVVCVKTADYAGYPLTDEEQVRAKIILPDEVKAPVSAGAIAGEIQFSLEGKLIGHSYLVFERDVKIKQPDGPLARLKSLFGMDCRESFLRLPGGT